MNEIDRFQLATKLFAQGRQQEAQKQLIIELIVATQDCRVIAAYKAVRAILCNGRETPRGPSPELKQSIALVRSVWARMDERPAYLAGMFAPETFLRVPEKTDGEREEEAQEEWYVAQEAQLFSFGYDPASLSERTIHSME